MIDNSEKITINGAREAGLCPLCFKVSTHKNTCSRCGLGFDTFLYEEQWAYEDFYVFERNSVKHYYTIRKMRIEFQSYYDSVRVWL